MTILGTKTKDQLVALVINVDQHCILAI